MHFTIRIRSIDRIFTFVILLFLLSFFSPSEAKAQQDQEFYQLKVYHFENQDQRKQLENYLEHAYMPALHRAGLRKIGVFYAASTEGNENEKSGDSLLYVLIPFSSLNQFSSLENTLDKDEKYKEQAKEYLQATFDKPPYSRYESILMQAFSGMPTLEVPKLKTSKSEVIYELRSYEAATELLHLNKVKMFNEGEIDIFNRLGFNAVFYARVIAGSKLPNLIYMTSFENMASRDDHWKRFRDDPAWKKLSSDPQYKNNFLRADIYLLHAAPYSEI